METPEKKPPVAPEGKPSKANESTSKVPTQKRKHTYRGFTFKERCLPAILVSLLTPLTVGFIIPFEIYGNNTEEFKFVLADFWALCLLITLGSVLVLATVLLVSRGRLFDVLFGLVFGLSLMFFIQGNYLSLSQTTLVGDGIGGGGPSVGEIVLNSAIWLLVTAACIVAMLLLNRYKDTVRLVSTMAVGIMLFMSLVSFMTVSLTTDVYAAEKGFTEEDKGQADRQVLSVENLDTLATGDNIVVFLVDRFDDSFYDQARENYPEIFDELEGFTHFDDYVSRYPRTFPSVPYLITGKEDDFTVSREVYFEQAYTHSPLLHALKDAGYDINLYTDAYYSYEDAAYMADYVSNTDSIRGYEVVNRPRLSLDMLRLSLYRALPTAFRFVVGDVSTAAFDRYVKYDTTNYNGYSTGKDSAAEHLLDEKLSFRASEKGYSFIHMAGCHLGDGYTEAQVQRALTHSMDIISDYLREMKRLGVYEEATILILGDHASILQDDEAPSFAHMTSLLVKPAGVSEGAIAESTASLMPEDVFATILAAADSPASNDYGHTVFEIPEGEERRRTYYFQRKIGASEYEQIVYEITGDGRDFANWHIVDRYSLKKSIYR